jgi:hypothetical protein
MRVGGGPKSHDLEPPHRVEDMYQRSSKQRTQCTALLNLKDAVLPASALIRFRGAIACM